MVDERTLRVHQVELVVNARPQKGTISSVVLFLYLVHVLRKQGGYYGNALG